MIKKKILLVLFIFVFLASCGSFEVYNKDKYNQKSPYYTQEYGNININVVICADFFASKIEMDYKANYICSMVKKEAYFVKVSMFKYCYLLKPLDNIYECV